MTPFYVRVDTECLQPGMNLTNRCQRKSLVEISGQHQDHARGDNDGTSEYPKGVETVLVQDHAANGCTYSLISCCSEFTCESRWTHQSDIQMK